MNNLSSHAHCFNQGVKDAFQWQRVFKLVTTSKTVQHTLLKSLALNGVVYLGLLVFLETFYNSPDHHLYGYSYTDLTGYPLYLICLLVNARLYNRIAQYQLRTDDRQTDPFTMVITIILYINFALFIALIHKIPFIGVPLSFLFYCIVMAYYCFEYKWINQDWTMEQRMLYAEQHWAYCLGFGLPGTALTFFLSTLRAGGVFAIVYPFFIMMASSATPLAPFVKENSFKFLPYRMHVFAGIRWMNTAILQTIRTFAGSRGAHWMVEKKKDNLGKLV
ncbi:etoposide-induced protein 2.4-domain-containing protein [Blakeslea trispora]|nr:etoposide-induced protein 2.4-domain-containing protein [Blakeslea trispora]